MVVVLLCRVSSPAASLFPFVSSVSFNCVMAPSPHHSRFHFPAFVRTDFGQQRFGREMRGCAQDPCNFSWQKHSEKKEEVEAQGLHSKSRAIVQTIFVSSTEFGITLGREHL